MTPNDSLQLYIALKLHFTSNYDYFKYKGKLKQPVDFTKRNDKYSFAKLSRHRDPRNLLLANLSVKPTIWVGDLFTSESEQRFRKMIGRWESLPYIFKEDLKKLDNFDFTVKDHQHPQLLKLYLQKKICVETLCILNKLVLFSENWNVELTDPVWRSMSYIIPKYEPFIEYNLDKMKGIFLSYEQFKC